MQAQQVAVLFWEREQAVSIYDEYLSLLEQDYLNEEQIKFLLQFECPLSVCYDAWLKTDVSYMEILHVAVNNLTEGLIADDTI